MAKIQNPESLKIEQDLLIHRLKNKASGFLMSNSQLFGTDIEDMVQSQNNLNNFVDKVEHTTQSMIYFWKGLTPEKPNFDQLNEISGRIADDNEEIKSEFENHYFTAVQKTQVTLIYVGYLVRVMNRAERSPEIKELLHKVKIKTAKQNAANGFVTQSQSRVSEGETNEQYDLIKREIDSIGLDFIEESHKLGKKGIIIVGGDQNNIGKIINMNSQMPLMLGYKH